jgi:hypothetical protein
MLSWEFNFGPYRLNMYLVVHMKLHQNLLNIYAPWKKYMQDMNSRLYLELIFFIIFNLHCSYIN